MFINIDFTLTGSVSRAESHLINSLNLLIKMLRVSLAAHTFYVSH